MPTYDPTGHPRLSGAAQAIDAPALASYAEEAEALFGIGATGYTGRDAEDLTLAVVRQVNLTLRMEEHGGGALWSESKGDQASSVARDIRTGKPVMVDAIAQAIVDRILAAAGTTGITPADLPVSRSTPNTFVW